jgi:sugar phosphate isomerase/epimerase
MRIHYSLAVSKVLETLPILESLRIGAEIYLEPDALESWRGEMWQGLASAVSELPVSIHAPFWNLDLLSPDSAVAQLTQRRLEQTLHAASYFSEARSAPVHIVFHSGIPHGRTSVQALERADRLVPKLERLVSAAREVGAVWCLENTHEPDPNSLRRVLGNVPELRYCFDAAHAHVFSRTPDPQAWLSLKPAHLHLNDNAGVYDDHLPLGTGVLPHLTWLPEWSTRAPMILETKGDPNASVTWLRDALEPHDKKAPRVLEALTVG